MQAEENRPWEGAQEPDAGPDTFERSENVSGPATPPEDPGVVESLQDVRGPEADERWEDPWPATGAEEEELEPVDVWEDEPPPPVRITRRRGTLAPPVDRPELPLSPQQKLLLLDTWQRSGLPARDFGALVNVSHHTLYSWRRRFQELGPGGLVDRPRGVKKGSKLPELTKRAILMLKQAHPEWGCERISDMLVRGPALPACARQEALVRLTQRTLGLAALTKAKPAVAGPKGKSRNPRRPMVRALKAAQTLREQADTKVGNAESPSLQPTAPVGVAEESC